MLFIVIEAAVGGAMVAVSGVCIARIWWQACKQRERRPAGRRPEVARPAPGQRAA